MTPWKKWEVAQGIIKLNVFREENVEWILSHPNVNPSCVSINVAKILIKMYLWASQ